MLAGPAHNRRIEEVLEAFESLGFPRSVVTQWSVPARDACDLADALPAQLGARVLEIGTFVGTSALFMLLTRPDLEVHTVDPNFPLEIEFDAMHCGFRSADLTTRTQEVAARAAELLGVRARLHLHQGGFATEATFAGENARAVAIGEAVIAQHGPFDAVFLDGLHFEEAVLADLRLAATAVREGAPILLHDTIGYWGSCVRRAVCRFLEERPAFSFSHAPYADLYRSIGRLTTRPAESDAVALRAERSYGAALPNFYEYTARALTETFGPLEAQAHDEFSAPLVARLHTKDGGARCAVLLGTLDELMPDASHAKLVAVASSADVLVLGLTPPGEAHAAGTWSRPLAARVAAIEALGFDAFDVVAPFLEPFSYALGSGCVLPCSTTFLSTTLVAVRRGTRAWQQCASRDQVRITDARRLEDARTQRVHDRAMLGRFRADLAASSDSLAQCDALLQRTNADATALRSALELAQRDGPLLREREEQLASVSSRLQHMLDWRVHLGRHHFWRRLGARL